MTRHYGFIEFHSKELAYSVAQHHSRNYSFPVLPLSRPCPAPVPPLSILLVSRGLVSFQGGLMYTWPVYPGACVRKHIPSYNTPNLPLSKHRTVRARVLPLAELHPNTMVSKPQHAIG
eukprot:204180-Amorphochlora_amoeboformis.AAC.1